MKITGNTVYYFYNIQSLKLFIQRHGHKISFADSMLLIYNNEKYYRFYKKRGEKHLRWAWSYKEEYKRDGYNIFAYGYQRTE